MSPFSPKTSADGSPKTSADGSPKTSADGSPKTSAEGSPKTSADGSPKSNAEGSARLTPEDLVEIEEIRQLKARYFHLMDQKRWDEWADVFCEDVLVDTTQEGSPLLKGRTAFVEFLAPILDGVKTVHHGHASEIRITGPDTATGTWSMEDHLWWPPEQGGRHLWGTGFYFEKYRKDPDGQWRILEMKLRRIRTEVDGQQVFPPEET